MVGFGFQEDVRHLAALHPSIKEDDVLLYQDLQQVFQQQFSWPQRPSLARVVAHVLGLRLDKTNQVSNWERRPLRRDQYAYAAIDAWVLVRLQTHVTSS